MATRVKKTFGAARVAAVALLALAGLAVATVASMPRHAATASLDPEPFNTRSYLGVLGLNPEALAAAGLSPQQAERVMELLDEHMQASGPALDAAVDAWGAANRQADLARRAVQSGKGRVDVMNAADQALAGALSSKNSSINAAFSAAVAELEGPVADTLVRIRTNKPQNVPTQYLVLDRTSSQWARLRDALSQQGVLQRRGEPQLLDEANAAVITAANGDTAVITAANHLATNLAAIKVAMGL